VALRHPGGAEDRDSIVDVAQGVEAAVDLLLDPLEPKLVLLLDVAGLPQQLLIAPRPLRARRADRLLVAADSRMPPAGFEPAPRGLKGAAPALR